MSQRPIHQCQCEICQSPQPHADKEDHHRMNVLLSRLNEQQRRWYVALEAGTHRAWRHRTAGADYRYERQHDSARSARVSRGHGWSAHGAGAQAGRWAATAGKKSPAIEDRIKEIVNDDIAGSPTDEQKWVKLSLRTIASRLRAQAYRIGRTTVGRLLRKLGFGLVANRKSLTGAVHPDRNRQFDYIRRVRQQFLRAGYPVISVDTKNKELIGNFANQGRTWRQAPAQVNLHDFPGDALGRAVPYGIYDIVHNQGYVYLGNSYDTPEFAAHAIAQWWADPARPRFPHEDKLLILCDAGGSNNCRSWLWKAELQRQCADRFGIPVLVCHYPTGASKYNPIEYRLFSQITRNWAGKPLRSFDTMRNYIRSTTTTTGLTVKAFLVDRAFQKGRKVSKEQRQTIQLTRRPICPTWNYMIAPTSIS